MKPLIRVLLPLLLCLSLLPAAALAEPPAIPGLQEGVDYRLIEGGKPFAPQAGKIEVAEVFGYTCIHCYHFEPILQAWKRQLPKDVQVVPVPAAFGGYWIPYARAFYAARRLGVQQSTHQAVFDALHLNHSLPIQNASADEIASFYASQGVGRARFMAALRGPEVDADLERARDWAMQAQVTATPSLIVNGKYLVIGGNSFDDLLKTAEALVAHERQALRKGR
ncbi:dihydroneopterin aldolase [Pseudoxanthomonas kalamensis DSM 18571]|uniref:thiol:disulfide interchange protein DsbA/DsbL n=1 Tax=Pseudoxanthomonas kalamensis TaxID=289483 RepID=UPI001390A22C|nr:thiol:disulfide interchange protein DsbA/DsbL [Pseudoxanthomonas kalamensis]KAF1712115.1 dihydroneopterin aldolase [Pseudoxanthomonas kalamensis DSM 18571]